MTGCDLLMGLDVGQGAMLESSPSTCRQFQAMSDYQYLASAQWYAATPAAPFGY